MFTTAYAVAWAQAFAFTELVEAPIYRRLLGVSVARALAASAITHPFVWFVFPPLADHFGIGYVACSLVSELFAWLVEATFFVRVAGVKPGRAMVVSLVANGASVGLGFLSRALFDWP